jgi:hypothetical protein
MAHPKADLAKPEEEKRAAAIPQTFERDQPGLKKRLKHVRPCVTIK